MKSTNKLKINTLINSNESLNTTYKIDKNNDNLKIDNYYHKNIYNKNNNINNNKDIILAIKKKIKKEAIYRANNINISKKEYK